MKARLNQASLYLTITLMSALMGGCGLFGGGESTDQNVQPSPQPVASQPFPKPTVPIINAPSKIALTRPTNPDDRLRVIKSGRNDPFGLLVKPQDPNAGKGEQGTTGGARKSGTTSEKVGDRIANSYDQFLKRITDAYTKPGQSSEPSPAGPSGTVNLPTLPKEPEPASVRVTGVVVVAGAPRAIVEAPNEPTSRTVGIGDSLSGGQLYVKNIDLSNRAEPVVVFQQGSMEFAVAVGRDPVLLASASPAARPVRGLYSVQAP